MRFSKPVLKKIGMIFVFLLSILFFIGCEKYDWYRATRKNTIPAYEYFMKKHNVSLLLMEASDRLKELYFKKAKRVNFISPG